MSASALTRGDRSDLWSTGIFAALSALAVVVIAVWRLVELFSAPGGLTVTAPVVAGDEPVAVGASAGQATSLRFFAPGVNVVSVACLVLEIVLVAGGFLAVIALAVLVVRRAARDRAFARGTSRLVMAIALVLLGVSVAAVFLRIVGLNGAFAAVDAFDRFDQQAVNLAAFPIYIAAAAVASLGLTFRRGERLQKETEGLV